MSAPFDIHSAHAGDLAQNFKTQELSRRRKAEELIRTYEQNQTKFGSSTVTVLHQHTLPPKMTPEQWDEEYGDSLKFMDDYTRKCVESEKLPQTVHVFQQVTHPIQCGVVNRLVFRGDTRGPSLIFSTGFAQVTPGKEVELKGEKTEGGISTSTDPNIVRRKYGNCRDYIYVCWLNKGIDTHDFNKLDEVIALHIEPKHVIASAGPIYKPSFEDEFGQFRISVGEIRENPACNIPNNDRTQGLEALKKLCDVVAPKTGKNSWEV